MCEISSEVEGVGPVAIFPDVSDDEWLVAPRADGPRGETSSLRALGSHRQVLLPTKRFKLKFSFLPLKHLFSTFWDLNIDFRTSDRSTENPAEDEQLVILRTAGGLAPISKSSQVKSYSPGEHGGSAQRKPQGPARWPKREFREILREICPFFKKKKCREIWGHFPEIR